MIKRYLTALLALVMLLSLMYGCKQGEKTITPQKTAPSATEQSKTVLKIAGPWEQFVALDTIAASFTEANPNCTIEYEFLQDYYESLERRLQSNDSDNQIDIFITTNIQADNKLLPYTQELYSVSDKLDLSNTFEGLVKNFEFRSESASSQPQIYAVPLGAELRGMFVNKTLLNSLQIPVPTKLSELNAACDKLVKAGFVPLNGNPGMFSQRLFYPYICNTIANAQNFQEAFSKVNNREPGISSMFTEQFSTMYSFVQNNYYDYKYVENTFGTFVDSTDDAIAKDFLNIVPEGEGFVKKDDVGMVAFMPSVLSLSSTLDKTKEDYHSAIEYEFILSPVSEEGGYAYMSPAHGIAANKNSESLDYSLSFLNYLFTPENNKLFAEIHNIAPNTSDSFDVLGAQFNVPSNRISHLGQVTFDYSFYNIICDSLVEISKANNPKYMQTDSDGNVSMYPFEYYMQRLEDNLMASKTA